MIIPQRTDALKSAHPIQGILAHGQFDGLHILFVILLITFFIPNLTFAFDLNKRLLRVGTVDCVKFAERIALIRSRGSQNTNFKV